MEYIYFRLILSSLYGCGFFLNFLKNHKAEYRKNYFSVFGYLCACYYVSIRELTLMIVWDILTFLLLCSNLKMVLLIIIYYLLALNFIYLLCLYLSLIFNEGLYFLISIILKVLFASFLIYAKGFFHAFYMIIYEVVKKVNTHKSFTQNRGGDTFAPFNIFLNKRFTVEKFLRGLFIFISLNLLVFVTVMLKLKANLKGNYGKFIFIKV